MSPNVFWVDLTKFNFAVGQPTSKLDVDHGETFSGDAASKFKPAGVFNFIPVKILAHLNPGAPQGPNATETEMLPDPVGDEDNPN